MVTFLSLLASIVVLLLGIAALYILYKLTVNVALFIKRYWFILGVLFLVIGNFIWGWKFWGIIGVITITVLAIVAAIKSKSRHSSATSSSIPTIQNAVSQSQPQRMPLPSTSETNFGNLGGHILSVGNTPVFYNSGLPSLIGNQPVNYLPNGKISSIGNQSVSYDMYGCINLIGNKKVEYYADGSIMSIGGQPVNYADPLTTRPPVIPPPEPLFRPPLSFDPPRGIPGVKSPIHKDLG